MKANAWGKKTSYIYTESQSPDAEVLFKKAVSALTDKRKDYLSALGSLDDTGDYILRLLFLDSASVIQDCIEIVSDAAREYGIPIT